MVRFSRGFVCRGTRLPSHLQECLGFERGGVLVNHTCR
jgi:hypothetical protein